MMIFQEQSAIELRILWAWLYFSSVKLALRIHIELLLGYE
jgi:hypothetical protein